MVTKDVLLRILSASDIDGPTRGAVRLWLDGPLSPGHYRVVSIAGKDVRAATADGASEDLPEADEQAPTSTMLN